MFILIGIVEIIKIQSENRCFSFSGCNESKLISNFYFFVFYKFHLFCYLEQQIFIFCFTLWFNAFEKKNKKKKQVAKDSIGYAVCIILKE